MKTIVFLLLAFLCWPVLADEPVNVPLSGTRYWNVEIKDGTKLPSSLLLMESMRAIHWHVLHSRKPLLDLSPGFVVEGIDEVALKNAHDIWVREKPEKIVLPANTELSLVIRTYGEGVMLKSLTRDKYGFTLGYTFRDAFRENEEEISEGITETERNYKWAGIALIPISKLPVGKYEVDIVHVTYDPQPDEYPQAVIRPEVATIIERGLLISQPFIFNTESKHEDNH